MLAAIQAGRSARIYELLFRLNHQLPLTRSGQIEASLSSFSRSDSSIAGLGSHRRHACYAARIGALSGRTPKAGRTYPFKLSVDGAPPIVVPGKAVLRSYPNLGGMRSSASKLLDC
jgi:hypothetical protein